MKLVSLLGSLILTAFVSSEPYLFDCTNAPDGRYSIGDCQTRYLKCSGGFPKFVDCPQNLVFDGYANKCDKRGNVDSCDDDDFDIESKDDVEEKTEVESASDAIEELPEKIIFVNVCESLEDGTYPTGICARNYYTCNSKVARFRSCWPFYYDSVHKECSRKVLIENCQHVKNETVIGNRENRFSRKGLTTGNKELISFCSKRNDGSFPIDKCSDFFLTCYGLEARIIKCSENLVFDPVGLVCDTPSNVTMCSDLRKSRLNCEEDGFYPVAECSSMFTICKNGSAFDMICPTGLKFSQKSKSCDIDSNIRECPKSSGKHAENAEFLELIVTTMHDFEKETDTKVAICYPNFVLLNLLFRQKHGFDLKLEHFDPDCLRKVIQLSTQKHERDRREIRKLEQSVLLQWAVIFIFAFLIILVSCCAENTP